MDSAKETRFCKFCGEMIEYLDDFEDYYCTFCQSFQTTNQPSIKNIDQNEHLFLPDIDESLPPFEPPEFPLGWKKNLPIFRHSEYGLKPIFSLKERHIFYNRQGQKLGEFKGKTFNFKGNYTVHDLDGDVVATIDRRKIKFGKYSYDVKNHTNEHIGSIVIISRFFNRTYELIDEYNKIIGFSKEPKIFRPEFDVIDKNGREIITLDRKIWSGTMKIAILSNINPLLALSYGLILSIMISADQAAVAATVSAGI